MVLIREKNPAWRGGKDFSCIICGKGFWRKPYKIKKGHIKFCSHKCKGIYQSIYYRGKNSPVWKGGVVENHHELRLYEGYRIWRKAVFERDNYACQGCGDNRGHNLNAHHILSFNDFPHKRLDISNGITLCIECHKKIHKRKENET